MQIADVCILVADSPDAHGVFDDVTRTGRQVYCTVRSVSMSEVYQARAQGLYPQFRLKLDHDFEYDGERRLIFRGALYDVIRTYTGEEDGIELTVQRSVRHEEGSVPGHA